MALYHRSACEAASEDMLLELADWAYRKLAYLNSEGHAHAAATARGGLLAVVRPSLGLGRIRQQPATCPAAPWKQLQVTALAHTHAPPSIRSFARVSTERSAQELMAQAPEEELDERAAEVAWGAAMCGLTIARYLTEHVGSLPLGVMAQLVATNDTIMALLPLVDRPPWVRRNKGQVRGAEQAVPGCIRREPGCMQLRPQPAHQGTPACAEQSWVHCSTRALCLGHPSAGGEVPGGPLAGGAARGLPQAGAA